MEYFEISLRVAPEQLETAAALATMASPDGEIETVDKTEKLSEARFWVTERADADSAAEYLRGRLEALGIKYKLCCSSVTDEGWMDGWKRFYKPVRLGKRLVAVPSWESYTPKRDELTLLIDPGAAFGSGTHRSTALCARLLEECVKKGDSLLDLGCGSGILAIAGCKLGASRVAAADIDEKAVDCARDNFARNGCRGVLVLGDPNVDRDARQVLGSGYDVIAVNIVADIIIADAAYLKKTLKSGGALVAGGIITPRADEVLEKLSGEGFSLCERLDEDGWTALRMENAKKE